MTLKKVAEKSGVAIETVRKALNFVTTDHIDKILDVALNRAFAIGVSDELIAEEIVVPVLDVSNSVRPTNVKQ